MSHSHGGGGLPVGAIYMSVVDTNPSTFFGGTWERLKDRFLLGAGDTYAAGATGGEATHTLTVDEMPSHNHYYGSDASEGGSSQFCRGQSNYKGYLYSSSTGGNQAHNNMPPYLTVYMWKRTA